MFKGKKHGADPNATDTLIGEGTTVDGKLRSAAGIRIEGQVTGDVECDGDVMIGEKGMVKSSIQARSVYLAGTVQGHITVKEKLTIHASGKLYGNTSARTLIIEEGGIFQGTSLMNEEAGNSAAALLIHNGLSSQEEDNKRRASGH